MFRKSKQTISPLPKPPTEAQMVEDLQLFHETRPAFKHISSENIPALIEESTTDEWWKVYEASLEDHEQFRDKMDTVQELKQALQEAQSELQAACKAIQAQIDHDLDRLRATMKD
uniref:Uncharacterized protein n=1 Tax=Anopheles farauti TaxID=69004 RepID=A0A182QNX1_9DIPT